jgi:hypothetical protein
MTYSLFIDDERFPPTNSHDKWLIARNFAEVKELIKKFGVPNFISFDHDLGENEKTGKEIANYLIENDLEYENTGISDFHFPKNFCFAVHSQNPVGAKNIQCLLENYFAFKQQMHVENCDVKQEQQE